MDDTELRTITFKVSNEEAEAIDTAAREGGFTRSDYIRQRLLNLQRDSRESPQNVPETRDPTVLLHHIIYGLQRIHTGMYMMVGNRRCAIARTTRRDRICYGAAWHRVPQQHR